MTEPTAEQRAQAAAESLAAEGIGVDARKVRERAGVRMSVATAVARQWNEREAATTVVAPPVPAVVTTRFEAIWREAFTAATEQFAAERAGWQQRLEDAAAEVESANEDLDAATAKAEQAHADAAKMAEHAKSLAADLEEAQAALGAEREAARVAERAQAAAEAKAAAAEGLLAGMRESLAAIRREAPTADA